MALQFLHYADIEAAYDHPDRIGRLAGAVARLRDESTVVCGSGDNVGPGVLSLVTAGRQSLDFFRAVDADAETFGNHDFDHGTDALLDVVADAPQTWLCANARRDDGQFGADVGVEPWTVVEAGEYRVGLVGVAHPETAELNPEAAGIEFTEPVPAVEAAVESVRTTGVDIVAVVSHLGDDTELARAVDADLVLGGHDHEPLVTRAEGTLVCRPGGTGRYLLVVSFDGGRPTATHHDVSEEPRDSAVVSAIRRRIEQAGLADVVGTVDDPIVCDLPACKRGESRIGNLITDAYRWRAGADVALHSGGGFRRREPLSEAVTAFDLVRVVPYDAPLLSLRVDGETLRTALRQLALMEAPDDVPRWHFGHVSGAEVVWDDAARELRAARVQGDPVDPTSIYEVATTEFFVSNEQLFGALEPDDVVARLGSQYEAVVDYVREEGLDVAIEGRIRRPTLPDDAVPERDCPNSPA